jgi:hypothetical protein
MQGVSGRLGDGGYRTDSVGCRRSCIGQMESRGTIAAPRGLPFHSSPTSTIKGFHHSFRLLPASRRASMGRLVTILVTPGKPRARLAHRSHSNFLRRVPGRLATGEFLNHIGQAIEGIRRELKVRGPYSGPVNGVLDKPTMKAIYAFQRMAGTLQICGVPTLRTRRLLEQGSHADPSLKLLLRFDDLDLRRNVVVASILVGDD